MKNDFETWEKLKSGSKSALSHIYFHHYQPMFQYGIKFKNEPEFIKDCIQDVFIMLIKAGGSLGTTDNIRFYLLKALKNKIIKEQEKNRKKGVLNAPLLEFDSQFSLEEEILQKEKVSVREKVLASALEKLSERQREIIYLRYECELDYNQICELMQLQYDSARKLVLRAIKSLRKIIDNKIDIPILFLLDFSRKHIL